MRQRSSITRLKFTQSDSQQSKTVITSPSALSVEVIPLCEKKLLFTLPWRCWPSCGPCVNIPFKLKRGKRPSISWLVENIYDWLVPQRSLTGKGSCREVQRQSKTVMTHRVSWLSHADCIPLVGN